MPRTKTKQVTKWTSHRIDLYLGEYCNDAKKHYLDQDGYKAATQRLTARTGWTLRELEGWLATSKYKACKGNAVMGAARAREEAAHVARGGPRGERAKAVRAIRKVLEARVSGAVKPVVTFAMVGEMRGNKRDICRGAREGVTAAILMAAAQEEMQVEMFEVGSGGREGTEWRRRSSGRCRQTG